MHLLAGRATVVIWMWKEKGFKHVFLDQKATERSLRRKKGERSSASERGHVTSEGVMGDRRARKKQAGRVEKEKKTDIKP